MSEQNNEQIAPIYTSPPPPNKNTPVDDVVNAIRDFISKAPDTFNKAVERAVNVRDTTVLLRLAEQESDAIDTLVTAGIYKSRADAANFLIAEGIKAQAELFAKVESKMEEIEKLRSELRQSVAP